MNNKNDSMRVVRRVISYFRALEGKSDPKEQEELWTRIRTDIGARDRRRRRLRLWSTVAAASLVGCMWLGYGLLSTGTSDLSQIAASMMGSISAEIDEIQLITEQGKAIKINDGSTVTYTPDGKIDLGDKQMRATPVTQEQYDRIVVPKGRFSRLVLADGSSLYINSNTQVVYPKQFEKDKREIFVDGEIYIDVHPDPAVPFIVRTADFDVEVLGTAFDVKAYGGKGNGGEVVLVRGVVNVKDANGREARLKPDNKAVINLKTPIQTVAVDAKEYILWTQGILPLRNGTLGDILEDLSRYYDVRINCNKNVKNIKITGKIDLTQGVDKALYYLSRTGEFSYYKQQDTYFFGDAIHTSE